MRYGRDNHRSGSQLTYIDHLGPGTSDGDLALLRRAVLVNGHGHVGAHCGLLLGKLSKELGCFTLPFELKSLFFGNLSLKFVSVTRRSILGSEVRSESVSQNDED